MTLYNPFSLERKTILITGASSGIGRSVAIECAKMGAALVITGRNDERLNDTFTRLEGAGHIQIAADLQDTAQLAFMVDTLPELTGIVHCAGITKTIPFQFASREKIDAVMDINFYTPVELTRLVLKMKKIAENSSIVFISSISGVYCAIIGNSIYSASKGAINGIVKNMALELASKGIRINSVNPGQIETAILDEGTITAKQLEEDRKRYPLKRHGKPEEIAYGVIYLLSDASRWITGSNLVIDGGFTLL